MQKNDIAKPKNEVKNHSKCFKFNRLVFEQTPSQEYTDFQLAVQKHKHGINIIITSASSAKLI